MSDDQIREIILNELKELKSDLKEMRAVVQSIREEQAILKVKMQWGSGLISAVTSVIIGAVLTVFRSKY